MGAGRYHPRARGPARRHRIVAGLALGVVLALTGAAVAAAQSATLTITVPAVFKTRFVKHGRNKGLAKKSFNYTVAGADPNPGALLDLFVRPGAAPCAANANAEGQQAQPLIAEQPVNGSFSVTKRLKPVKGASRFCAYTHTGGPSSTPDATATATFTAVKKG